ncbi:glycerophosphodiester phosphodiesterase [Arthrobacter sp. UYEF20]|uniref:glycerophosphodiester phosphodiesterase n=1 Tax=Arthrobacter sp. UYEF20 TaxID=1756363 RepID=UPI00339B5E0F
MFKSGALLLVLILCSGCTATPPPAPEPTSGPASAPPPSSTFTLVAHRGGSLVYPESSAEAFEAVSRTAFPIETDLRPLRDGTLVPLHDDTVDRTMSGVTGRPADITPEQWKAAHIKNPQGGAEGSPTTWEAMLDEYGGRSVLVPEVKDPAIDLAAFADSILRRGVRDTVIVQSFSYPVAQTLAKSGLQVLYLLHEGEEPDPAAIRSSGIDHVGPDKRVSADYLRRLKDAGLTVWPYTVNDGATASRLRRDGADGVFTDDPWELSKQLGLG